MDQDPLPTPSGVGATSRVLSRARFIRRSARSQHGGRLRYNGLSSRSSQHEKPADDRQQAKAGGKWHPGDLPGHRKSLDRRALRCDTLRQAKPRRVDAPNDVARAHMRRKRAVPALREDGISLPTLKFIAAARAARNGSHCRPIGQLTFVDALDLEYGFQRIGRRSDSGIRTRNGDRDRRSRKDSICAYPLLPRRNYGAGAGKSWNNRRWEKADQ